MPRTRRSPDTVAPIPRLLLQGVLGLRRAARWGWPRLARAARATSVALAAGAAGSVRGLVQLARRRRALLVALACRAAWWGALAIFATAGAALLGFTVDAVDDRLWHPFALGLSLCALVVLMARERHLRWLATALGTSHAVLGLLAFGALQG